MLRTSLQQAGLSVFQDEQAIRAGDQWLSRLQTALSDCGAFIVLIGRDGIQRWVGAEVQVALNRYFSAHDAAQRLPIYPVLLPGAQREAIPPFLGLFQFSTWSAEQAVPSNLIEAIRIQQPLFEQARFEGCPYLGLSAFSRRDAPLFFGRRQETLQALTYLGNQQQINPKQLPKTSGVSYTRWLQIEGNSGSGKSSMVNAGMLPLIEQGVLWARTGFSQWHILGPMMPGKDPIEKLAEILERGLKPNPADRDITTRVNQLNAQPAKALTRTLKQFRQSDTAFLLIVDQFEELLTFAETQARKQFDALLADALQDSDCPLFLINTVRADFLDRFEFLPCLQQLYNDQCKRYFLPLITENGLREIIEQPAFLAQLDVSEITTTLLNDAKDELGALPLVENALTLLWEKRQQQRLSGTTYREAGGLAGMLKTQADALLAQIDKTIPKGKEAALELLFALTRINDEGRHTRQRLTREEAIYSAGNGNADQGEKIVQMLSGGERSTQALATEHRSVLRLLSISQEQDKHYVDLIHETLVRARSKDQHTGKWIGYWPTLYDYIEKNQNRDIYRQQLRYEARLWSHYSGLWGLRHLASYFDLRKYRTLRVEPQSTEGRFVRWNQRIWFTGFAIIALVMSYIGESFYWRTHHELPLSMMLTLQTFRLGHTPIPTLTPQPVPIGSFDMGEQDQAFIAQLGEFQKHFGVPGQSVAITQPLYFGQYEVTYEQYDYYVWQQHRQGNQDIAYPTTAKGGRGDRPVVNVTWWEATAYATWLGKQHDTVCRLPTEAEWEYAARAGLQTAYPWGEEIGRNRANCSDCGSQWDGDQSAPVGQFTANALGLFDTVGNVWEWTCSNWRDQFDGSEQRCNNDSNDTQFRVLRGGSWFNLAYYARSAARGADHPDLRFNYLGFRVVCVSSILE